MRPEVSSTKLSPARQYSAHVIAPGSLYWEVSFITWLFAPGILPLKPHTDSRNDVGLRRNIASD